MTARLTPAQVEEIAARDAQCGECGEPCIDAGPGLGWQCVSDKPHSPITIIDRTNPVVNELRDRIAFLESDLAACRRAIEVVRPHVDLVQARLNGSYCTAKIDEHTFCGRAREWPGHRSNAKEWPEHEFVDGGALVAALSAQAGEK